MNARTPLFAAALLIGGAAALPGIAEAPADSPEGSIEGVVLSAPGRPVTDAVVTVEGSSRRSRTDERGWYRLDNVPAGAYRLHAESRRHGSAVQEVVVEGGSAVAVDFTLAPLGAREDIVVRPPPRRPSAPGGPAAVLEGAELDGRSDATLGESLSSLPGVAATSHAAAASRPVLRGFGGSRVRILQDGMDLADASAGRDDNAVAFDARGAEAIEILRGPAALAYGTDTVGGVVNVVDTSLPDHVPARGLGAAINLRQGTNADSRSQNVSVEGGVRDRLGWQASLLQQRAEDAEAADAVRLVNSDLDTEQYAAGASLVRAGSFVGLAGRSYASEYGIPTPRGVRIDMRRERWDAGGEIAFDASLPAALSARLAHTDYVHDERIDASDFVTRYDQETIEARLEGRHGGHGARRVKGLLGAQFARRSVAVSGSQPFMPPFETRSLALFAVEELSLEPFAFRLGLRWDQHEAEPDAPGLSPRSFSGLSAAGALVWRCAPAVTLELTLSRSTRPPAPEELYVDGPHLATFQYEIGDPNLGVERSLGAEVSLHADAGRIGGRLHLFAANFDDYIYFTPTGNTIQVGGEEVPEARALQRDAAYRGAEGLIHLQLLPPGPHALRLSIRADLVRAELDAPLAPTLSAWLPRIPPARMGLGLDYETSSFQAGAELVRVERQDRVALFETPTAGHTLLNARAGYRHAAGSLVHVLSVRLTNLTDEPARNHVSTLKDLVPLPGRNLALDYALRF